MRQKNNRRKIPQKFCYLAYTSVFAFPNSYYFTTNISHHFQSFAFSLIMSDLEQKGDLVIVVFTNPIYIQKNKFNIFYFIAIYREFAYKESLKSPFSFNIL